MSPDTVRQIQAAMRRPVGTLGFRYTSPEAFGLGTNEGVLFQVVAGGHVFRIERSSDRVLSFFHSSPGTGTRVASISLKTVPPFDSALLWLIWSPEQIEFSCGPLTKGGSLLSAKGTVSPKQFRVGEDGSVFTVGDLGVEVMGARVVQGGRAILNPTAIEAWNATLKEIEVLRTGTSTEGFVFECVLASVTIVQLVTGMEAYASTRVWEIEAEGVRPNIEELFAKVVPTHQRDAGLLDALKTEAQAKQVSVLRIMLSKRVINFQNYSHLKLAFKSAYGLPLNNMGITSTQIARLKTFINYRHRIVHVSPLMGILNIGNVPPDRPEFANDALAIEAISCFREFVSALHKATLELRPTSI